MITRRRGAVAARAVKYSAVPSQERSSTMSTSTRSGKLRRSSSKGPIVSRSLKVGAKTKVSLVRLMEADCRIIRSSESDGERAQAASFRGTTS
jgi:hypothetical protein